LYIAVAEAQQRAIAVPLCGRAPGRALIEGLRFDEHAEADVQIALTPDGTDGVGTVGRLHDQRPIDLNRLQAFRWRRIERQNGFGEIRAGRFGDRAFADMREGRAEALLRSL